MFRLMNLFCLLAVWLGIISILSINSAVAFAGGKPVIYPQLGSNEPIYAVTFSDDGKYIISLYSGAVVIWEVSSGRSWREFRHDDDVASSGIRLKGFSKFGDIHNKKGIAYSPDKNFIAEVSNTDAATILIKDAKTGKLIRKLGRNRYNINDIVIAGDGNVIYSERASYGLVKWNTKGFFEKEDLHAGILDSRYIIQRSKKVTKKLFLKGEIEFFKITDSSNGKSIELNINQLPPDSRMFGLTPQMDKILIATFQAKHEYQLLDAKTLKKINSFNVPDVFDWQFGKQSFSPDGKNVALLAIEINPQSKKNQWVIYIFDVVSGNQIKKLVSPVGVLEAIKYGHSGNYLFASSDYNVYQFDTRNYKVIKTFHSGNEKGEKDSWKFSLWGKIAVSSDDKYLIAGDAGGIIHLWDISSARKIKTFSKHSEKIISTLFSPDNKKIISGGDDGTTRLWDISTGKEIAQFISFTDGEWIVITPEGYFNASPNGAKYLNVRIGNNVYSIDNFYEKFFNPVYVASVLQGKKVEAVADIRKGILTPPDVKITSPEPNTSFSTDTVTITVSAKDTGGGIDEIRLYHNGKAIGEDTRAVKIVPKGNETIKTYTVALVDGLNAFRATAFSKDRTESNPYELIVKLTAPSKEVSLYVLAVGINKYKNPALNLNYAEPDARGISDFFKQKGKGLFKNVEIKEIYNEQATKETIISKFNQLQNTNPQDAVLIYLAGHGENINDKWYFIPHELTYPEREADVKTKGISSDELSGYIKNIKAQKILVLIDACKSGAVLIAFRGFEDRKALSQLSRSTGVHIVAASTKDQFAAEVKELGHGVFTYTLLEGLKGKAAGKGETVTVRKLMGYIEEKLPDITKKYKQEAQFPVVDSKGMDFPLSLTK